MKRISLLILFLFFSRLFCNDFNSDIIGLLKLNNKEEIFITQINKGVYIFFASIEKIDSLSIIRKDKKSKTEFIIYDDKIRIYEKNNEFIYYYPIFDNPEGGKNYEYEIIQIKNNKKNITNINFFVKEIENVFLKYEDGKLSKELIPEKDFIYFKISYVNIDYGPYDISLGFGFDFFYPGKFNFPLSIKYNPFTHKYLSIIGIEYYPFNERNNEFFIFSKEKINPSFSIKFVVPVEFNLLSSMAGINLEGRLVNNLYYKGGLFLDFLLLPSFLISLTWEIGFKYYFGYF